VLATSSAAGQAAGAKYEGTIAFIHLTPRTYGARLFDVRADGKGLRPLTPPYTKVTSYAWAPDATLIAYTDQQGSLWLVRPDGTGRRLLLSAAKLSSSGISWSPNGKEIAITSSGPDPHRDTCDRWKGGLYVVPISGAAPTPLAGGRHVGCSVAWSAQGDEIYYGNDGGIWAIHPNGSGRHRVSPIGGIGAMSADGTQFAFDVRIPSQTGTEGWFWRAFGVVSAGGTNFHVVTTHAYTEYGFAWSPTSNRILYGRADSQGIFVIDSDGRNNKRVTRDSPPRADWGALAWSPDGNSIVYDSGGYESTHIYLIGLNGRNKAPLTSPTGPNIDPSWVTRAT
jgi:Tol biopolymer transport system component